MLMVSPADAFNERTIIRGDKVVGVSRLVFSRTGGFQCAIRLLFIELNVSNRMYRRSGRLRGDTVAFQYKRSSKDWRLLSGVYAPCISSGDVFSDLRRINAHQAPATRSTRPLFLAPALGDR